ncbi:MAG: sulfite exporter TauE/SafE family protein, partial [Phycisphaerales bacterium]|nr:sulfite exporter TauE/SafE family protein [Phycisphaerales bacterium]
MAALKIVILIVAALATSALSGMLGMAGGILLLAIMFSVMDDATEVIPLHGAVQLVSNVSRATLSWRDIAWRILGPMIAGSVAGAVVGSQLAITLPESTYQFLMGAFILVFTWMPKFKSAPRVRGKFFWLG